MTVAMASSKVTSRVMLPAEGLGAAVARKRLLAHVLAGDVRLEVKVPGEALAAVRTDVFLLLVVPSTTATATATATMARSS